MPEDVAKHLSLPNFTTPIPGTLRGVLDNDITPRYNISLNGLGIKKVKSGGLSLMLKTVMEVSQDCTIFNYVPPSSHEYLKYQGRTIVAQSVIKPVPKTFLPGHSKEKIGKEPPQIYWVILMLTQVDPLWGGSSNLEHQQYLVTQYIHWMGQGHQRRSQDHMRSFSTVPLGYG